MLDIFSVTLGQALCAEDDMSEQQKPLTTDQIAGGRSDASSDDATIRETSHAEDNGMPKQGRSDMESNYAAGGMGHSSDGSNGPKAALMPSEAAESHREHWMEIQTRFVDDPKDAVEQADGLVAEVMQVVATRFAEQRKGLESQWQQGREASTEDLRKAMQQYRSFFERLLAA
jgi:hypothetical protein